MHTLIKRNIKDAYLAKRLIYYKQFTTRDSFNFIQPKK